MNKVCCNINNRRDDGDSLVNILTVVGSSQESHDFSRERFKCIDCYKKCVGCEYFVDGDYYNPPECSADVCTLLEDKKEEER